LTTISGDESMQLILHRYLALPLMNTGALLPPERLPILSILIASVFVIAWALLNQVLNKNKYTPNPCSRGLRQIKSYPNSIRGCGLGREVFSNQPTIGCIPFSQICSASILLACSLREQDAHTTDHFFAKLGCTPIISLR